MIFNYIEYKGSFPILLNFLSSIYIEIEDKKKGTVDSFTTHFCVMA